MKNILLLCACFTLLATMVAAQTSKKPAVKSTEDKQAKSRPMLRQTSVNARTSPAIDSFKRTLRYSPGRPYATAADSAGNTNIQLQNQTARQRTTNTPTSSPAAMNNQVNNQSPVMNPPQAQTNIPQSPSMELNRADVNQRPVNENSKNAISEMNSSQVNALNGNQMAPPPANWGNTTTPQNWGRNTVGENQWNPGEQVTQRFMTDFPGTSNATWTRDTRDTLNYSVRYQTGNTWSTSTYTPTGTRLYTQTQLPLTDLPRPVALFTDKQGAKDIQLKKITRINRPGKGEVFELQLSSGESVFINEQGVVTSF